MDGNFFFFKQKTAYEITYGDWSSDVCSSDLLPLSETAPVPKFRFCVPPNVKLVPILMASLVVSVSAALVVLSIVPPPIVKAPVPNAEALLIFKVPELSVVPPLYVFAPESVSVPTPDFVKEPTPASTPATRYVAKQILLNA